MLVINLFLIVMIVLVLAFAAGIIFYARQKFAMLMLSFFLAGLLFTAAITLFLISLSGIADLVFG